MPLGCGTWSRSRPAQALKQSARADLPKIKSATQWLFCCLFRISARVEKPLADTFWYSATHVMLHFGSQDRSRAGTPRSLEPTQSNPVGASI
jgi:hypothetical protein